MDMAPLLTAAAVQPDGVGGHFPLDRLFLFLGSLGPFGLLVAFAFSVFVCFYGGRLYPVLVFLIGFAIGGAVGVVCGPRFVPGEFGELLGMALCGAVAGFALWMFHQVGIFCFGGALAMGAVVLCVGTNHPVVALIGFAVGGVLALAVERYAMTILTAIVGSVGAVAFGTALLRGGVLPALHDFFRQLAQGSLPHAVPLQVCVQLTAMVFLFILGCRAQLRHAGPGLGASHDAAPRQA